MTSRLGTGKSLKLFYSVPPAPLLAIVSLYEEIIKPKREGGRIATVAVADGKEEKRPNKQWWATILKNVSFKAIQIHNF